ncbi:MAG: hypothetical protein RLZZ230_115 [Candidatus Parcubacteria bacterium]|jgi:cytoskeletal protein CcmA (bactofilin family)
MRKKILGILLLTTIISGVLVVPVEAKSVLRSGDTVSIAEDQIVEGDFYAAGSKINVSGEIKEDIVTAGGQTTLNGSVGANAFMVGGRVDIHGTVGDDLRIVAGEVTIAEPVMGDLLVIGGSVNILSSASVAGDVIIFAGDATIEGSVGGDVIGRTGSLRIDAPVGGDVDVTTDQLTLGDNAAIEGSVRYVSGVVVVQSLNANVGGDLMRSDPPLAASSNGWNPLFVMGLILLFSVLAWYLVSRKTLQKMVVRATSHSLRSVIIGFVVLTVAPFATAILLFSAIGTVVGFVALLLFLLLTVLGVVGSVAVAGSLLLIAAKKQTTPVVTLLSLVLGIFVFTLLLMLPVIGLVLIIAAVLVTIGSLVDIVVKPKLT